MSARIARSAKITRFAKQFGVPDGLVNAEFKLAVNSILASRIRLGRSQWQVDTGYSRDSWYATSAGLRNNVRYARFVRPPGQKPGASLRRARAKVDEWLPEVVRFVAQNALAGRQLTRVRPRVEPGTRRTRRQILSDRRRSDADTVSLGRRRGPRPSPLPRVRSERGRRR